jgi:hypothetical protein
MPQGKLGASSHDPVAVRSGPYQHKRIIDRSGPVKLPKNENAAQFTFIAALPTMTRNVEMMTAGKLVQSGGWLKSNDLKLLANQQAEKKRKELDGADPLKKIFTKDSNRNIKGLRGDFDVDELAELVPELKKTVDQARKGAAKKNKQPELDSGKVGNPIKVHESFGEDLGRSKTKKRARDEAINRAISAVTGGNTSSDHAATADQPHSKKSRSQQMSNRSRASGVGESLAPLFGGPTDTFTL